MTPEQIAALVAQTVAQAMAAHQPAAQPAAVPAAVPVAEAPATGKQRTHIIEHDGRSCVLPSKSIVLKAYTAEGEYLGTVEAKPVSFNSGSFGYRVNGKVPYAVGKVEHKFQFGGQLTVCGSKPAESK